MTDSRNSRIQSGAVRVALLFIDGVGVGRKDPAVNPLAERAHLLSQFADAPGTALPEGGRASPVDTTFGVPGRPQSASNQTAILTGEPAPALIQGHVLGYPNPPLRRLLAERSLVQRLVAGGLTATFANSYPAPYLDALKLRRRESTSPPEFTFPPGSPAAPAGPRRRRWPSPRGRCRCARWMTLGPDDGLTHDITGAHARARGLSVPQRTPEEAAAHLLAGGRGDELHLLRALPGGRGRTRAGLQRGAAGRWTPSTPSPGPWWPRVRRMRGCSICSDHGNVEDLSTRSHTLNPVPVLYFGPPAAGGAGAGDRGRRGAHGVALAGCGVRCA